MNIFHTKILTVFIRVLQSCQKMELEDKLILMKKGMKPKHEGLQKIYRKYILEITIHEFQNCYININLYLN